ncbi:ABC transporter permease [Shewanella sp. JM162201]|uniref:ABC transporter permease n=1 Tax=Shewanella jiangmenensis TaxID=2837387 RepID=A0ABS5V9T2_9GAMM|nr:ABC transporter permease [Shewanella jiangmenensis]MBT1446642.1 ABC transporter permease [Shewanella jiangmenensis]
MITRHDLSAACYALSKAKGYAATVVLTLGLTLGALIAMFNLNYQILAAPLPYPDEEQLIVGSTDWRDKDGTVLYSDMFAPAIMTRLYRQPSAQISQQALLGYSYTALTLRDKADTPKVQAVYTTPGYMQMYQMPLLHGRAFSAQEDIGSHQAVAIISEHIWRTHYNADPALIGQTIQLGATAFKVIGIAASQFEEPHLLGPARSNDLWLPWDFGPAASTTEPSALFGWHFYLVKLQPSASMATFSQEVGPQIQQQFQDGIANIPTQQGRSLRFAPQSLRDSLNGDSGNKTFWMLAGSLLLLAIASANISNLLLSRAAQNHRSMAIRAALGAQRHHLRRIVFTELCCLLSAALLIALLVAQGCYLLLQQYAGDALPQLHLLTLNLPVLVFAVLVSSLLALIFATLIGRQLDYSRLQRGIQSSGKGQSAQVKSQTRQYLIGTQILLATLLLVCSAQVLVQSIYQLRQDIGFATANRFQVDIDNISPPSTEQSAAQRQLAERQRKTELMQVRDLLQLHPAIASAAVSNYPPVAFDGLYGSHSFLLQAGETSSNVRTRAVTTDQYYLPMFALRLLEGRNFVAQEVTAQSRVVIINQTFANALLAKSPGDSVVGRQLHVNNGEPYEIIGVVADLHLPDQYAASEPLRSYLPSNLIQGTSLLYQLKPGMQLTKTELNQLMSQVSPYYRAANVYNIADNVDRVLLSNYLAAAVTAALVLLSFVLAAIGIYGVLHYNVQMRRFELGVRMAIGARPSTILRQLLGENLKPVLAGLALAATGLVALWLAMQKTTFTIALSSGGFALPLLLIVLMTVLTTLLSVWSIIRKPAIYALQGR